MSNTEVQPTRKPRGFAAMHKDRQRAIASHGGKAAHAKGVAHEYNSAEAAAAARKGHELGTCHQFTSEEARRAGRLGGLARARQRIQHLSITKPPHVCAESRPSPSPQHAGHKAAGAFNTDAHGTDVPSA